MVNEICQDPQCNSDALLCKECEVDLVQQPLCSGRKTPQKQQHLRTGSSWIVMNSNSVFIRRGCPHPTGALPSYWLLHAFSPTLLSFFSYKACKNLACGSIFLCFGQRPTCLSWTCVVLPSDSSLVSPSVNVLDMGSRQLAFPGIFHNEAATFMVLQTVVEVPTLPCTLCGKVSNCSLFQCLPCNLKKW